MPSPYPPVTCRACGYEMSLLGSDFAGMRKFKCFRCNREVILKPLREGDAPLDRFEIVERNMERERRRREYPAEAPGEAELAAMDLAVREEKREHKRGRYGNDKRGSHRSRLGE